MHNRSPASSWAGLSCLGGRVCVGMEVAGWKEEAVWRVERGLQEGCMEVTLNLGLHLSLNLSLSVSSGSCRVPYWFLRQGGNNPSFPLLLTCDIKASCTARQKEEEDFNPSVWNSSLLVILVSERRLRSVQKGLTFLCPSQASWEQNLCSWTPWTVCFYLDQLFLPKGMCMCMYFIIYRLGEKYGTCSQLG